jgi:DNA transformation protein and related proteins
MPQPDRYTEFVLETLAPLGQLSTKFMFGGWAIYCDGAVFALIADGELYLKGDKVNIPVFTAQGMKPFRPFPDQDMVMKYYQAPPAVFEDHDAMRYWCGLAIAAAERARKAKPKKAAAKRPSKKSARSPRA